MTDFLRVEDIVEQTLARIPSSRRKEVLQAFTESYAEATQELEDVVGDCILFRSLDSAVGVQLDQYGSLLTEPRDGLTDVEYRSVLRAKILSNSSNGQAELLVDLCYALGAAQVYISGALIGTKFEDSYPPTLLITIITEVDESANQKARIKRLLERSVSAGVKLYLSMGYGTFFSFDEDTRPGAAGYDVGGWVDLI